MMRARLLAGFLGLGLAIAAIATNDKRLTWAAIAALVVALVIRVVLRRKSQ
jgi:hypothetical protein